MKIEFESQQIANYLRVLKEMDAELLSYCAVYEAVKRSGRFPDLELVLEAARAATRAGMDQKYDPAIDKLSNPDQSSVDWAVGEFLAATTPKGRPN